MACQRVEAGGRRYGCVVPRPPEDDYYAVLGLPADVEDEEIRRTWRRLAMEWHPDRAGPGTTHAFARMSVAYAVISDPDERAAYDKRRGITRASAPAHRSPEPKTPTAEARSAKREATTKNSHFSTDDAPIGKRAPGVLLHRISGPLNILMARGVVREHDDSYELLLDAEEAREGGMVTISMRVLVRCPACEGTGHGCATCGGERVVEDLFAAWLAVRPGVADGTMLTPSARLPNMVKDVAFRVRLPS